jgi:hypothetical protein
MRNFLLTTCLGAVAVFATGAAHANDELIRMSQNPKDWVMPTGNYANHRYSRLKQITAQNVGKLRVAWTFSTGVLRTYMTSPTTRGPPSWAPAWAVPEPGLRARPRRQDPLEIRAQAGSKRHSRHVLRHASVAMRV